MTIGQAGKSCGCRNSYRNRLRTLYGLASIIPPALAQPWMMGSVMFAWIIVPLALARWRFTS